MEITNFLDFFTNKDKDKSGYTVKKGETLYSIAKANKVSVEELKKANGIKGDALKAGQTLSIPGAKSPTVFGFPDKKENKELSLFKNPSDKDIIPDKNNPFIKVRKNPDYVVKKDENPDSIASRFGVPTAVLLDLNKLNRKSAIDVKDVLKIPPTLTAKNIKNVKELSLATGFSAEYLGKLIDLEGFHTKAYKDSNGFLTVGVGHLVKSNEIKKYENRTLSKTEVYTLLAQDLIDRKQNLELIIGKKEYKKMPQPLKDSVMDLMFHRGEGGLYQPGFLTSLRQGRYADAITKMTITYKKSKDGKIKHMSGLSKRRLFEIAHASKMFNGNPPKKVLNFAQRIYNQRLNNMKKEFPNKIEFANKKAGYNKEIQALFGDKIKVS